MDTTGIQLRVASFDDLEAIVALHLGAFPGFFLSRLGPRFLHQLYHAFVSDREGICLVAEHCADGRRPRIVGFVAGTSAPTALFRRALLSRGLMFAWSAAAALIRNPIVVGRRLVAAIWYRGEVPPRTPSAALLSSLAVVPDIRHAGIGGALVKGFGDAARARDARCVYLTTDQNNNDAVNNFYCSLGFSVLATTIRRDGRIMNTYVKAV